jgi:hypothetical protein
MPFCSRCGHQHGEDDRFCARCGRPVGRGDDAASEEGDEQARPRGPMPEQAIWEGQPHGVLNPIETHAVRYELTTERLRVIRGVLNRSFDDLELTRVRDVSVEQSLAQRALGIGNVLVVTTDASTPELLLHDVDDPQGVKELIRAAVREQRQRLRVRQFEDL